MTYELAYLADSSLDDYQIYDLKPTFTISDMVNNIYDFFSYGPDDSTSFHITKIDLSQKDYETLKNYMVLNDNDDPDFIKFMEGIYSGTIKNDDIFECDGSEYMDLVEIYLDTDYEDADEDEWDEAVEFLFDTPNEKECKKVIKKWIS